MKLRENFIVLNLQKVSMANFSTFTVPPGIIYIHHDHTNNLALKLEECLSGRTESPREMCSWTHFPVYKFSL